MKDTYFENIFQALELTNDIEQIAMRDSGFLILERKAGSTKEDMLTRLEKHFGLCEDNDSVNIHTERCNSER